MAKQTDPVCGMQIEEQEAAGQAEYDGRTYYFCSSACQRKFEENPEQYVNQ
ncbi:MAG: YHS domain-containing protein [Pyrinomonadaceae bacterium]